MLPAGYGNNKQAALHTGTQLSSSEDDHYHAETLADICFILPPLPRHIKATLLVLSLLPEVAIVPRRCVDWYGGVEQSRTTAGFGRLLLVLN